MSCSEVSFWKTNFWDKGASPWQNSQVHEKLQKYLDLLLESSRKSGDDHRPRVLVPLCGKTLDLGFLYQKGFEVIGIEGVEQAVREFFQENDIQVEEEEVDNRGHLFQVKSSDTH